MYQLRLDSVRRLRFVLALIVLGLLHFHDSRAQRPILCPQNLDLSFGSLLSWECDTGRALAPATPVPAGTAPIFSGAPSGPMTGRHLAVSGTGTDPYGAFPVTAPDGGPFSLRLGNDGAGAGAERLRYLLHVPPGLNEFVIHYQYAVVLEDPPGAAPGTKPAFLLTAIDSATQLPVRQGCPWLAITADGAGHAFRKSAVAPYPMYIPWTSGSLNLSGQGGRTIIIALTTLDGTDGGSFGYAYFDFVSCNRSAVTLTACDLDANDMSLAAPPGYASYAWYRGAAGSGTPLGIGRNLRVLPLPQTPTVFCCVATPHAGVACNDTLWSVPLSDFRMNALPDLFCRNEFPVQLSITASGGLDSFSYMWRAHPWLVPGPDPLAGTLGRQVHGAVTAAPRGPNARFIAMVADTVGCFRSDTVWLRVPSFSVDAGRDTTTCLGTPVRLRPLVLRAGTAFGTTWSPGRNLDDSTLLTATYTPARTGVESLILRIDSARCSFTDTINIRTLPNTFRTVDTAVCKGAAFRAGVFSDPQLQDSLRYTWSPAAYLSPNGTVRQRLSLRILRSGIAL